MIQINVCPDLKPTPAENHGDVMRGSIAKQFGVLLAAVARFTGLRRFAENQRGAVAVLIAVAVVPLFGFIGVATDAARGYMFKAKLQQAVDAAALAGGRVINDPDRDSDIEQYFYANMPDNYLGAPTPTPAISVDEAAGLVTVTASATMPTTLVSVLGIHDVTVNARSVVRRAVRGMELALIMDNTGSMRGGGKIDTMKTAAHDLIDILYGNNETVENFWVSLVPYAATVNVGNANTGWLQGFSAGDYSPTAWKGCVEARPAPFDQTDDLPAVQAWPPHLWQSTMGMYPTTGDNDWDASNIDESNGAQNDGLGPNLGCGPAITPLVAEQSTVHAAITEMQPWHRGGTMANLGLAWGWRTLSPNWRGAWTGVDPELPLDYNTPLMDKVAIILTDGVNQWYDWPGGLPGKPDAAAMPDADYTAYGRLSEGRLGTTSASAVTTQINNRMLNVCNAMKNEGIIVYTITFKLSNSTTQQLFSDCATDPDHYFNSPTNADLAETFETIGQELTNLRLAE